MFSIGDYVVKANEGVCRIEERVFMRSFDGEERPYYLLIPVADQRAKLYIPDSEEYRDVRPVMTRNEVLALIGRLHEIGSTSIENEKVREKVYKDALRSNDPEQLIAIMKSVFLRNRERQEAGKKITVVDDRCFKAAENALCSEFSFVLDQDTDSLKDLIKDTIFL